MKPDALKVTISLFLSLGTACGDGASTSGELDAAEPDAAIDAGGGLEPDAAVTPDAGSDATECTPEGAQLLENPEFDRSDENLEPWETSGEILFIQDNEDNPYSIHTVPNSVGHLTGVGGEGSARLEQSVQIPEGTTELALQFFLCLQTENINGEPDELVIVLESPEGDELDILAAIDSSEQDETNCSYEPRLASVDPGDYAGEPAKLVVMAETADNDEATFFLDTFSLKALCD